MQLRPDLKGHLRRGARGWASPDVESSSVVAFVPAFVMKGSCLMLLVTLCLTSSDKSPSWSGDSRGLGPPSDGVRGRWAASGGRPYLLLMVFNRLHAGEQVRYHLHQLLQLLAHVILSWGGHLLITHQVQVLHSGDSDS